MGVVQSHGGPPFLQDTMSDDAKLQKITLPPDFIDLSFGEPFIVRDACFKHINVIGSSFKMPEMESLRRCEYQAAQGNQRLVSLLENKYQAKVVVTNGAKHGLAAVFRALKKNRCDSIYHETPYYPANPGLIADAGLTSVPYLYQAKAVLFTSPNNPDGKVRTSSNMNLFADDKYIIHDAAYHTPVYLPDGYIPDKVGHVQIFSMSKMYGFSGLRIGYVVCHDESLFKDIVDYVETTTAGVSIASQELAFNIEDYFLRNPDRLKQFEEEARVAIKKNRDALTLLRPEIASPTELISNSMFAWYKKGPELDYMKAKVYMLEGSLFGAPDMVRMNIAVPHETLVEAIDRLNKI